MNDNGNGNGYVNLSDELKNSIEIGQTSKCEWYIKSIKVYFGMEECDEAETIKRLRRLKNYTESLVKELPNA